jgi:hypothetical protein
MVLAFSLQSDIKSIGAYAGFAAIIGLALLVLLYFAQAREIRRMSDWLDQQEERLRNLAVRSPMPRPLPTPPTARVVPAPVAVAPPEAGAAPTATVAVPGARRVAVGVAGALAPAEQAAPVLTSGPGEAGASGAGAAATLVGALAPASAAAKAASASDGADDTSDTVPPNRVRAPQSSEAGADAPELPAAPGPDPAAKPSGEEGAPKEGGSAGPGAAVPLTATPAATAEPVGLAQTRSAKPAASPDTSELAVAESPAGAAATLEPAEGVVARPAPAPDLPFDPQAEKDALFASDVAPNISAERGASAALPAASPQAPLDDDAAQEPKPAAEEIDEPPALAPATAAGARPRFPPPPSARATPAAVSASAVSGVGAEADAGAGTATLATPSPGTTRRRERVVPPADGGEDADEHHGTGSVLRLLAAAVVIVLVLVFIATKVFAPSKATGLIPSKVVVAVLNGTHSPGLAGQAAVKLSAGGFERGGVANALSQGHHFTLVGYTPGNRAAAILVQKDLAPTPTRVGPVDARTAALADSLGATVPKVIVTLGSNYLAQ